MRERLRTGPGAKTQYYDMEVIIGEVRHPVFAHWLAHMESEIRGKDYEQETSFWRTARILYVLQTTGSASLRRFLQKPAMKKYVKALKPISCNYLQDAKALSSWERQSFDVISHESNSWFTKEFRVHVPVGLADSVLPPGLAPLPTKRFRRKTRDPRIENDGGVAQRVAKRARRRWPFALDGSWYDCVDLTILSD